MLGNRAALCALVGLILCTGAAAFISGPCNVPSAASLRKRTCASGVLVCQWGGGGGGRDREGGRGGGWGDDRRERSGRSSFGGGRDRRGGGGGGWGREERDRTPRNDRFKEYTRGDDGTQVVEDLPRVIEILETRERARRNKDFALADDLRDELLFSLGVNVDDKSSTPSIISTINKHADPPKHRRCIAFAYQRIHIRFALFSKPLCCLFLAMTQNLACDSMGVKWRLLSFAFQRMHPLHGALFP